MPIHFVDRGTCFTDAEISNMETEEITPRELLNDIQFHGQAIFVCMQVHPNASKRWMACEIRLKRGRVVQPGGYIHVQGSIPYTLHIHDVPGNMRQSPWHRITHDQLPYTLQPWQRFTPIYWKAAPVELGSVMCFYASNLLKYVRCVVVANPPGNDVSVLLLDDFADMRHVMEVERTMLVDFWVMMV